MKTFEIQYVGRYEDNKEYYQELIKARTEKSALNKFAKIFGLKVADIINDAWWDGEWLMELRNIKEVEEHTCPHCNGIGKITVKNATN